MDPPPTADPTSPEFSVNHCKISKVQYILHSEISNSQCTTLHTVEARFLSIIAPREYHRVMPPKRSVSLCVALEVFCIIVCCLGSVAAWLQEWSPVSSPLNRLSMRTEEELPVWKSQDLLDIHIELFWCPIYPWAFSAYLIFFQYLKYMLCK